MSVTKGLRVVTVKMSAHERALLVAVAQLEGETMSAVARRLLAKSARARLRQLSTVARNPAPGGPIPVLQQLSDMR